MKHIVPGKKGGVFERIFPPPKFLRMPAVGVDISDSSVKCIEIVEQGNTKRLGRFGELPIPDGAISRGMIQNSAALIKVLADLRATHHLNFIRASLPEEHVYVFQTLMPDDTPHEQIRTTLEFQLEEHVPIAPRDAVFDYEVMQHREAGQGHLYIDVSVYPKGVVQSYLDAFRAAKLTPLSFEVEARAVARAVLPRGDTGAVMLVDFGRLRTGIAVVSNGFLEFTTTVPLGGQPISTAIIEYLKIPPGEVDKIKNERGILGMREHKELYSALVNTVSLLRDEINKHVIYWNTHKDTDGNANSRIEKILLCGGGANLAGLPEYLSGTMRIPTEVVNVWRNAFSFEEVIPELTHAESLSYATAIGLALQGTNHD